MTTKPKICRECGLSKRNVIANMYYIGGQGYVLCDECQECLDTKWKESGEAVRKLQESVEEFKGII